MRIKLSKEAIALLELSAFIISKENVFMQGTKVKLRDLDFKHLTHKLGLEIDKSEGLLQIIYKSGKHIGLILWYAIKAFLNKDKKSKEKLKKSIQNSTVTKGQFIDFLLKLDALTLGVLTGPLHIIDAVTGWNIVPKIKKMAETNKDILEKVFDELETISESLKGLIKGKFRKYIKKLRELSETEVIAEVVSNSIFKSFKEN